jgi:hypothetical protein
MRNALLACLLFTAPLFAQTVEERLARLEEEVRILRGENEQLRRRLGLDETAAPPPPAPQSAPVKATGKEAALSLGGYLQGQAETGGRVDTRFTDDNDRIFLRRGRLVAHGRFAEAFDFKVEVDVAGSLGNASGMRAQTSDAFVTWTKYPFANVRIGQFKTPYGLEQLWSDTRLLTPERALGSDRTPGRQLGLQLAGELANKRVGYAVGAFNGNGANVSFNDDEGFMTAARLSGTIVDGPIRWVAGVNGYTSEDRAAPVAPELGFANSTFAGERRAWGFDSQFTAGPVELWIELLRTRFDPNTGATRETDAGYILGAWSITPKLQAVARYETFEANNVEQNIWTVGTNYLIKGHDLKLQLHLMRSDDDDRVIARVQTIF